MTVVHQILSGAGPYDAVTTEAMIFRRLFGSWGWGGEDHAVRALPGVHRHFAPLSALRPEPEDVLLLHHSAGWARLDELTSRPNPKLLLYHNVTPPQWLWEHAPFVASQCAIGREQLAVLAGACDGFAADSAYNAGELAAAGAPGAEVVYLLTRRDELGPPGDGEPDGPPEILFVGRLSPHKRQDEMIRAFALLRRYRRPDARLTLVGDPITGRYLGHLNALAEELAPGAVTIETGLPYAELGERYRRAHAFLCLSEHEGFCIPLVEALHFGVPVLARPAGAVPETLGDAGLLVPDRDPAVVAELLHLLLADAELRAELRRRGRVRLQAFAPEANAAALRRAVQRTLEASRGVPSRLDGTPDPNDAFDAKRDPAAGRS